MPLLLAQFFVTSAMVGVIWIVQIVIYPQFLEIGSVDFPGYHHNYMRLVTWIVGPLMLVEIATAAWTVYAFWNDPLRWVAIIAFLLVLLIWGATAFLSVPHHNQLAEQFSDEAAHDLVRGNWIRTWLWTARVPPVGWLLFSVFKK